MNIYLVIGLIYLGCPCECQIAEGIQDIWEVDGHWGSWTEWSPCSVTCDYGEMSRSRKCNNPEPLHGGKECAEAPKQAKQCYGGIPCPKVRCPKVPKEHKFLSVADPNVNCFDNNMKVGQRCKFTCSNSYKLRGPSALVCLSGTRAIGKWNQNITKNPPTCVDITKPNFANNFRCDNGITITNNTVKGKNYGLINFDAIGVTDNSGDAPVIQSSPPGYELGRTYQINYTIGDGMVINFKASDAAGNFRICKFTVKVSIGYICSLDIFQLQCPDGGVLQHNDDGTVSCDGNEDDLNTYLRTYYHGGAAKILMYEFINGPYHNNMIAVSNGKLSWQKKKGDPDDASCIFAEKKYRFIRHDHGRNNFALRVFSSPRQYIGIKQLYRRGPPLELSLVNFASKALFSHKYVRV